VHCGTPVGMHLPIPLDPRHWFCAICIVQLRTVLIPLVAPSLASYVFHSGKIGILPLVALGCVVYYVPKIINAFSCCYKLNVC